MIKLTLSFPVDYQIVFLYHFLDHLISRDKEISRLKFRLSESSGLKAYFNLQTMINNKKETNNLS